MSEHEHRIVSVDLLRRAADAIHPIWFQLFAVFDGWAESEAQGDTADERLDLARAIVERLSRQIASDDLRTLLDVEMELRAAAGEA